MTAHPKRILDLSPSALSLVGRWGWPPEADLRTFLAFVAFESVYPPPAEAACNDAAAQGDPLMELIWLHQVLFRTLRD